MGRAAYTAAPEAYDASMSDESDLLAANAAFYAAFASGDLAAMDALWAKSAPVACCHPGWEPLLGRASVLASWRAIFESGAPPVRCEDASGLLLGEVALVICTEVLQAGTLAATNVFVREEGRLRLVHHHAGPVATRPAAKPSVLN
jgi:hypothetical protein